jgi:type II pantothenate kinase
MQTGIDIGGSLTKIVRITKEGRTFKTIKNTNITEISDFLNVNEAEIYATGCGAASLDKELPYPCKLVGELESFCTGARNLFLEEGYGYPAFILVSLGTGTSIFHVTDQDSVRVIGTGMGGGTITGLANLLLKETDFAGIMELASKGQRQNVDLMVSDLYPLSSDSPVLQSLTAANFGKKLNQDASKEDIASSIVQSVIETVAMLSIQVARTFDLKTIVIAGSPAESPLIRERFLEIGRIFDHKFKYLSKGAYCGALGAVLLGSQTNF